MATANVVTTVSGTGWVVDVTACNLDTNLNIFDVYVLHNNVPYNNTSTDYQKVTYTTLKYTGTALPANTKVEIRRKTPVSVIQPVSYASRITSDLWNNELGRTQRWKEEAELNGVGVAFSGVVPTPRDDAYSTLWDGDVTYPPTRNAVYDRLVLLATLLSPAFTGTPTAPTATASTNTTQVATTAFAQSLFQVSGSRIKHVPTNVTVQWGTSTVTTNAGGDVAVSFPTTFTTLYTVIAMDGDSTSNGRTVTCTSTAYNGTAGVFNVHVSTGGTAQANTLVRINWIAFGLT